MIDWNLYLTFLAASFFLAITPGPDLLFVFSEGLRGQKSSVLAISLGISLGNIIHTIIGVTGLSLLLKKFPAVLTTISILGALYLFYLAYLSFLDYKSSKVPSSSKEMSLSFTQLTKKAFLMNILNPKVSLFFLAFFPAFIPQNTPSFALSFLLLGISFILVAFLVFSLIGLASHGLGSWLLEKKERTMKICLFSVFIYIGLAIFVLSNAIN